MPKPRVLITQIFMHKGDSTDRYLEETGFETIYSPWRGDRGEEELLKVVQDVDGAVVSFDPFTRRVLEAADRLKVISRTGVGYDNIDVAAATERGIAVCASPGTNQRSVAEYTLATILQCSRKLSENFAEVRAGGWSRHKGFDLGGRTLGIVGLGTIGKMVAKYARALDMRVLAYDVFQDQAFADRNEIAYVPLEQLVAESDFVTLHCFLDESTRHLINADRLAIMKPTAYLINTARSGVVDPDALFDALKSRQIAGAALDVFDQEPLPMEHPLRTLDNVYLSPHVAAWTQDFLDKSAVMASENVMRVLKGERPHHVVNPEVLRG